MNKNRDPKFVAGVSERPGLNGTGRSPDEAIRNFDINLARVQTLAIGGQTALDNARNTAARVKVISLIEE